jgi:hypothetical protein
MGFGVSGLYDFEDTNLDVFRLHDWKQTTFYHGYNREDSFYDTVKNMKRSDKRRVKKWPSTIEFWEIEEPKEFRLLSCEHGDWRKFKAWLRNHLRQLEGTDYDFDTEAMGKYEEQIDLCLGDFDKTYTINHDMAIFKWDNSAFMTEEEVNKMPEDKKPKMVVPAVSIDMSKAKRIYVDKDDLKI